MAEMHKSKTQHESHADPESEAWEDDEPSFGSQPPRRRRRRSLFGSVFFIAFLGFLGVVLLVGVYALIGYSYVQHRLNDGKPAETGDVVFTINTGDSFADVMSRLEESKILSSGYGIQDRWIMIGIAEWSAEGRSIRAGTYRIGKGEPLLDVYKKLVTVSKEFQLTIPEGKNIREIAELAKKKDENFDSARFVQLCNDPEFVSKLGFPGESLEGYLFPSTYDFPPNTTPEALATKLTATFRQVLATELQRAGGSLPRPLEEVITIASLIEKEARTAKDRPLISGVIFNRLQRGMRLQIDATVNYALGSWRRLTFADYKVDHPYNTYKIQGLPPGPICSPGAASIRAALRPADSEFLFYVHKGDGGHVFAKTYAEHLENVRRYLQGDAATVAAEEVPESDAPEKPEVVVAGTPEPRGTETAVTTASVPAATPPTRLLPPSMAPRSY